MTEKNEIDLLYEAAAFCGFKPADGWPAELTPYQLATLMAGGWKAPHKQAYRVSLRMIFDAIEAGSLKTDDIDQGFEEIERDAARLPEHERYKKAVIPKIDRFGRQRFVYYEKKKKEPIRRIAREACRDWHSKIRKAPSEHVLAWLGPIWQEVAPKVGAGNAAPQPRAPESPPEPPIVEKRIAAIITTARRLGYDPENVAWGGKAAIKKECTKDAKLFTSATFDKAWQAARNAGLIDVEDSETYRKR